MLVWAEMFTETNENIRKYLRLGWLHPIMITHRKYWKSNRISMEIFVIKISKYLSQNYLRLVSSSHTTRQIGCDMSR